jgi:translation initiation factor IF-2
MRVYQIAEQVKLSNRVLVQLLQDQGVDINSHMSPLTGQDEELLRELLAELRSDAPVSEVEVASEAPVETPQVVEEPPALPAEVVEEEPEIVEAPEEEEPVEAPTVEKEEAPAAPVEEPEEEPEEETPATPAIQDHSTVVDKPAKPAGRRVRRLQEREAIDQSLEEVEEEKPEEDSRERPSRRKPQETTARSGPDRTRTYRFHKRGAPRTLRRKSKGRQEPTLPAGPVDVVLPVSVKDFSQALGVKVAEILRVLLLNGVRANINSQLDKDTVDILALEFGREVNVRTKVAAEEQFLIDIDDEEDRPEDLKPRAPIVAMLGHVDHGKTSLLDYIRKSDVAAREAGGITQHISSYKIRTEDDREIVFIDLPGHEAFTAMRGRGAQSTDIVILVIAAEEGVMPQTEESINHAKAAEVPVIVALNKSDKPEANPQKVKQELTSYGLIAEEWGGETLMVETSATTGSGIPELLESILLQSELLELIANPHKKAIGTVLEAEKSEGRGVLATVLVREGTLRAGDVVLSGTGYGRVRDIRNDKGETIPMAGPATPVEISGLSQVPEAGDQFYVVPNLGQAKTIAEERSRKKREESLAEKSSLSLTDLFRQAGQAETSEVPIIIKADMKGSVEAIEKKLVALGNAEVKIKILHAAVGSVNESDVQLASASQAFIVGFNVVAEDRARALANERGVEIGYYQIIYELIDDVKSAMEDQLAPEERESVLGHAQVRAVFRASKIGNIAGCYVTDGIVRRNARARLLRNGKVIHDRTFVESLKRIKDDAKEVREGFECGIRLRGCDDVQEEDVVEVYEVLEVKRKLEDAAKESED